MSRGGIDFLIGVGGHGRPTSPGPRVERLTINERGLWLVPGNPFVLTVEGSGFEEGSRLVFADYAGLGLPAGAPAFEGGYLTCVFDVPLRVFGDGHAVLAATFPPGRVRYAFEVGVSAPGETIPDVVGDFLGAFVGRTRPLRVGPPPGDRPEWSWEDAGNSSYLFRTNGLFLSGAIITGRDGRRVLVPWKPGDGEGSRRLYLASSIGIEGNAGGGMADTISVGGRTRVESGTERGSMLAGSGGADYQVWHPVVT